MFTDLSLDVNIRWQAVLYFKNGLIFLHHTIKALASTRLTADRRAFTELSGQIVGYILNLWHALHTSLLQQIGINTQEAAGRTSRRAE